MNDPPRMTEAQLRRARRLIRSLCANCNGGNCLLLDDGYEPCPCPQMLTCSVLCRYFRAAVLPADRELQAEIMADSRRRCRECRRPFVPKAKNTLYCPECAARRTRRSKAGFPGLFSGKTGAGNHFPRQPTKRIYFFYFSIQTTPARDGVSRPVRGHFLCAERSALWQRKAIPAARNV